MEGYQDPLTVYLESQLTPLAATLGFPLDQLKLILTLVLCCGVAFGQAQLQHKTGCSATVVHLYNVFWGLMCGGFMYGSGIFVCWATAGFSYFLMMWLPCSYASKVVFAFMMSFVFCCHTYRMITDYMGWHMDFTATQMMMTLKVTSLAFSRNDGDRLQQKKRAASEFTPWQLARAVGEMPSLLAYLGWTVGYQGLIVGPIIEWKEYAAHAASRASGYYHTKDGGIPAGRFRAAAIKMIETLLCMAVVVLLQPLFPIDLLRSPKFLVEMSLPRQVFNFWLVAVVYRFPYYFAWKFGEVPCILDGVAYNGAPGKPASWTGAVNCRVLAVELSQNVKGITDNWNVGVDHWLKHCVYERLNQLPSVRAYAVYLTLTCSAVWHGVYPGYYLAFLSAAMGVNAARMGRRTFRRFFVQADGKTPTAYKPLYDAVTWVLNIWIFNYAMMPFPLLAFSDGWRFWESQRFSGHAVLLGALVVLPFLGGTKSTSSLPVSPAIAKQSSTAMPPTPDPRKKKRN